MNEHQIQSLLARAFIARERAYAPYSGFSVGAALLTAAGNIYDGCNIENAAFSPSLCAERVALAKAVSEGERDFVALAIAGGAASAGSAAQSAPCYPCGVCRQSLAEFCGGELVVIVARGADDFQRLTLAQLFPYQFGAEQLNGE